MRSYHQSFTVPKNIIENGQEKIKSTLESGRLTFNFPNDNLAVIAAEETETCLAENTEEASESGRSETCEIEVSHNDEKL